jgi:DNA-directed RNA polymerase subunit RPC12/RpoP
MDTDKYKRMIERETACFVPPDWLKEQIKIAKKYKCRDCKIDMKPYLPKKESSDDYYICPKCGRMLAQLNKDRARNRTHNIMKRIKKGFDNLIAVFGVALFLGTLIWLVPSLLFWDFNFEIYFGIARVSLLFGVVGFIVGVLP